MVLTLTKERALYLNDNWSIRNNLKLNLGLRYEYFSPLTEKYGRLANLDISPDFSSVAVVTPGAAGPYSGSFSNGLVNPDYNNISPRLGLSSTYWSWASRMTTSFCHQSWAR